MSPMQLLWLAIAAAVVVVLVWWSSSRPATSPMPLETASPTTGSLIASIGASAAALAGGIADAAAPGGTNTQQQAEA